jgi:hypothetical protein
MPLSLSFPNRADAAAFSGQGWTAGLPLSFLGTRQISQVARAAGPLATLYATFAAPTLCDVAAIAGHNLTVSGRWRLRGYSADPRPAVDRSSQLATLDVRFTDGAIPAGLSCTRSSVATYFGAAGLLLTAAVNEARLQWTGGQAELLVEPAATNSLQNCRDWTATGWTASNMTRARVATGIDGVANSATRLTATANNATVTQVGGTGFGCFSVFVRRVSGSGAVELTGNGFTNVTAITLTSAWQRFAISTAATATVGIRLGTAGDVIEVDFAQHEVGGSSINPTSPILTAGGPATRQADSITYTPPVNVSLQQGTLVAEARYLATPSAVGVEWLRIRDAGNTNAVRLLSNTSRNVIAEYLQASTAQATLNDASQPNVGASFGLAFSWAANAFAASVNGAAAVTDTSGSVSSNAVSSMLFTALPGAGYSVARLTILPAASSNADTQALATLLSLPAPAYDSGLLDAWPAAWVSATTDEERRGVRGLMVAQPGQTLRWWRIDLSDPTNPSGYVELGRLFMGSRWRPQYGALSGATLGFIDRASITEADSGAEYVVQRPLPRVAGFDLVFRSEADAMDRGVEMRRQLGTTGELLYQWDDSDTEYQPGRAFLGRLRTLQPLTCLYRGHWRGTFEVKELL